MEGHGVVDMFPMRQACYRFELALCEGSLPPD